MRTSSAEFQFNRTPIRQGLWVPYGVGIDGGTQENVMPAEKGYLFSQRRWFLSYLSILMSMIE